MGWERWEMGEEGMSFLQTPVPRRDCGMAAMPGTALLSYGQMQSLNFKELWKLTYRFFYK